MANSRRENGSVRLRIWEQMKKCLRYDTMQRIYFAILPFKYNYKIFTKYTCAKICSFSHTHTRISICTANTYGEHMHDICTMTVSVVRENDGNETTRRVVLIFSIAEYVICSLKCTLDIHTIPNENDKKSWISSNERSSHTNNMSALNWIVCGWALRNMERQSR